MAQRLITSVRKAGTILKSGLLTGNLKTLVQMQPKCLQLRQFLSQLSAHPQPYPTKACGKHFGLKEGSKNAAFTASGIGAYRKSSSFSGGSDKEKKDEIENQWGPASFAQLVNAANSTDPQIQYDAVASIRKLMSADPNPPSQIDSLISCDILPALVSCLSSQNPALQFEAAWALNIIACGTSQQAEAVLQAGAVPHLLKLLTSPHQNVCQQAIWALGNMISHGPQLRDYVINLGVVAPLLSRIQPDITDTLLVDVTWLIWTLCRYNGPPPPPETLQEILHALNFLVNQNDRRVLVNTVCALVDLTAGGNDQIQIVIDSGVLPKLVELLNHREVNVQAVAVKAVRNIVTGTDNDNQAQAVLNCDALSHFHSLLNHPNANICKDALWVLANTSARNSAQVQAVIDAGLAPLIIHHLEKGEFQIRKAAMWAVRNMTFGNKQQVAYLINCGAFPALCNLTKCQDLEVEVLHGTMDAMYNIIKLPMNQDAQNKVNYPSPGGGWDSGCGWDDFEM